MLSEIKSPEDIKSLSHKDLVKLSEEIRKTIIEVVGKNGGHLASNLGVVELTIALHRVFDSPKDALIWDVSNQSYTHKLLTGRYKNFSSLRQDEGLSGFTRHEESVHDFFDEGHASTSISQALGLLTSWKLQKKDGKVVAIIGDGALTGGMALEGLSNAGQLSKNLIVVLNDNQMSIDRNTGAISRYLSKLTMTRRYQILKSSISKKVSKIKFLDKLIFRFKRGIKGLFLSNNLFSNFGFDYFGPFDGHDEAELEKIFKKIKCTENPVVVHVVTKKGKGYSPAEDHPERFHGVGPLCLTDGSVEKFDSLSFTEAFSVSLMALAQKRDDIVCITAAMGKGTGLDSFARHYPERFFDVGIAEEHAVTFAGGLAKGGLLPIVCIYSTFMQRSVDQVIHDIALQNVHVIMVLDRAGAVAYDGETHQGIFDISLFRAIPNIQILSPVSACDLEKCLVYASEQEESVIIRYPKLSCPSELGVFESPCEKGKGLFVSCTDFAPSLSLCFDEQKSYKKLLYVTTGGMYSEVLVASRALLLKNIFTDIYILRFIKPFSSDYFISIARNYDAIVFVEDGIKTAGISEELALILFENGITSFSIKAFPEKFISNGTRAHVLKEAGLSSECLVEEALSCLENKKKVKND